MVRYEENGQDEFENFGLETGMDFYPHHPLLPYTTAMGLNIRKYKLPFDKWL
jgi:hypothetical protein